MIPSYKRGKVLLKVVVDNFQRSCELRGTLSPDIYQGVIEVPPAATVNNVSYYLEL